MECKNCGSKLDLENIRFLNQRKLQLETELEEIIEKIQSHENGFCDSYCENNYDGNFGE